MPNKIVMIIILIVCLLSGALYISLEKSSLLDQDLASQPAVEVSPPEFTGSSTIRSVEDELADGPVPDFSAYKDVVKKKKAFFTYLLPEIRLQNNLVRAEREKVVALNGQLSQGNQLLPKELDLLDDFRLKYRVKDDLSNTDAAAELLKRVDIIPPELILVQAANESGWGTSRFAQKGFNFFGLWCFKKDCGFVPKQRNAGTIHEVAKFRDLSHAVKTYIHNLNRHYAYAPLREIRYQQRQANQAITAKALVHGLKSYSERGTDYIDELLSMMRVNRKHMAL